jgi:hypothetical protein
MGYDVIREYCKGENRAFQGTVCDYLIANGTECLLLRTSEMEKFWEACRYRPIELIYKYADVCTYQLTRQYSAPLRLEHRDSQHVADVEDVDFQALVDKLRQARLDKGFTLVVWCGYVKKTVYLEIRRQMTKRGLLHERKDCGHCKYLALGTERYFCALSQETRNAGDSACPQFSADVVTLVPDSWEPEKIQTATQKITQAGNPSKSPIIQIIKLLRQRFEQEPQGKKRQEKYWRQYEVFKYISHLLDIGTKKEDAKHLLATVHNVNKKTIERDLEEIGKFLQSIHFFSPKNVASNTLHTQGVSHNESE